MVKKAMLRIVTFKIEEELLEAVDIYAKHKNLSRSEVIRLALRMLLENDKFLKQVKS